jgi:hypothetical protein
MVVSVEIIYKYFSDVNVDLKYFSFGNLWSLNRAIKAKSYRGRAMFWKTIKAGATFHEIC